MTKEVLFLRLLNDQRMRLIFLLFAVFVYCDFEYESFIYGKYAYAGFDYEPDGAKSFISYALLLLGLGFFFLKGSRMLKAIAALFFVFLYIPNLVIYQYMELPLGFLLAITLFLLILCNPGRTWVMPKGIVLKKRQHSLFFLGLALLIAIPFFVTYSINWNPKLFLLGELTYVVREASHAGGNPLTTYLFNPLFKVLLPMLIIYGLKERQFYLSAFGFGLIMLLFMALPHKNVFFSVFVVLFFYFFKDPLKKVGIFIFGFLLLLIAGKMLVLYQDSLFLESVFYRRFLMLPAYLNIVYYDLFKDIPLFFSHSILSSWVEYPLDLDPSHYVGLQAFNSAATNANNGFFSDGFMNLGMIGPFLFVLLVGWIFKFFDALKIHPMYFGVFFLLVLTLRSSALLTAVVTHGVWALAILSYFILRNSNNRSLLPTKT